MSDQKQSQFIEVQTAVDSDYFPIFGQQSNRKISKPNLFEQISNISFKKNPLILQSIFDLQNANLADDPDTPNYVYVEEYDFALFKIVATAPGLGDVVMVNGNTASLQAPFRVGHFGVKGDGSDEIVKLQKFVDRCTIEGQTTYDLENLYIGIGSPLLIRPAAQTTSSDVGSNIHFMQEQKRPTLKSSANGGLFAKSAMSYLIRLAPVTIGGLGSYANFYAKVEHLYLDGKSLSLAGIFIDQAMHVECNNNVIDAVQSGIKNTGYGVHDIYRNVIRASEIGIDYIGGGDSTIEKNDLYIPTNKIGIKMRPFAGSTLVLRNTLTPVDVSTADQGITGILIAANEAGDDVKAMGAVEVAGNCFDGMKYGVRCLGYSSGNLNVRGIDIHDNYVAPAGSVTNCSLARIENSLNVQVHHNRGSIGGPEPYIDNFVYVLTSYAVRVNSNVVHGTRSTPITFDGCNTCSANENYIESGAAVSATEYVLLKNSTVNTTIQRNEFWQLNGTGAVVGVRETTASNSNRADWNRFVGLITTEYATVGAATIFKSRLQLAAAPATGTWLVGATNERPAPASAGYARDVCTTAGTPGTWKQEGLIT